MSHLIQSLGSHYPSLAVAGGAILSGVAAIDMAQRAVRDLGRLQEAEGLQDFSANLGGALFYGICAANIVPYTAVLGAVGFSAYSLAFKNDRDMYATSKIWGNFLQTIIDYTFVPLADHVILPLCNWVNDHVLTPLARTIMDVAAAIFKVISLPQHPVWYGVAALVALAVTYTVFPGALPFLT